MAEVHARTLKRAAEIAGGEQRLALKLKVTPSHLALWIAGIETPPLDIFLRLTSALRWAPRSLQPMQSVETSKIAEVA